MDAIVAICSDWAIGKDGQLLVRNKDDMHRFVQLTRGGTVVMGRKTYESFPKGPLRGRRNIIVTHDASYLPPKAHDLPEDTTVEVVTSPEDAIAATAPCERVWLIGGESLYRALLPQCERCRLTLNKTLVEGADAFFPNLDADPAWELASHDGEGVTAAGVPYEFLTYRRVDAKV